MSLSELLPVENLLDGGDGVGLVLLHDGVEGEELEVFVLLGLGRHGLAAVAADLDLQSAALVDPFALGIGVAEFGAGVEGAGWLAFFVFGVGSPVESAFGSLAVLLDDLVEEVDGVGPAAFVDGAGAVGVEGGILGGGGLVGDELRLDELGREGLRRK